LQVSFYLGAELRWNEIAVEQLLLRSFQDGTKLGVSVRHQLASLALAITARIGNLGPRSFDDIVELRALRRR
jgi:hypothetical protein